MLICAFSCVFRYHTVQEFNKGVYDYIIASDESAGGRAEQDSDEEEDEEEQQVEEDDECPFALLVPMIFSY